MTTDPVNSPTPAEPEKPKDQMIFVKINSLSVRQRIQLPPDSKVVAQQFCGQCHGSGWFGRSAKTKRPRQCPCVMVLIQPLRPEKPKPFKLAGPEPDLAADLKVGSPAGLGEADVMKAIAQNPVHVPAHATPGNPLEAKGENEK